MRIGFTGSRDGTTTPQMKTLIKHLVDIPVIVTESHYGDCVGADESFMWFAVELGNSGVLHSHPATLSPMWDQRWRAHTATRYPQLGIIEHLALPPLSRNRIIVDSVDRMYACPGTATPQDRSGTWSTIKYAQRREVPVVIIGPDGEEI